MLSGGVHILLLFLFLCGEKKKTGNRNHPCGNKQRRRHVWGCRGLHAVCRGDGNGRTDRHSSSSERMPRQGNSSNIGRENGWTLAGLLPLGITSSRVGHPPQRQKRSHPLPQPKISVTYLHFYFGSTMMYVRNPLEAKREACLPPRPYDTSPTQKNDTNRQ